ncbi:MAG: ferredoxin [Christensenellaceae bacterium]|nr:ferredoxin [Christensenellaceae bacterium]
MIIKSHEAEQQAILNTALQMCAAARTAPKACGIDHIEAVVVTGEDLETLALTMEYIAERTGMAFFTRDAAGVRKSGAVVLLGTHKGVRKLGKNCGYCGYAEGCRECAEKQGICAFDVMDLGIAIGSAVSIAADNRLDNRILFSAGKAAMECGLLSAEACDAVGIPLAAAGKSPFFDRK